MELSRNEIDLITRLRTIPFGEVTIVMHNGQPDRIERVLEKQKLGGNGHKETIKKP